MSRLEIKAPNRARIVMEGLYKDLERRIESSPPGLCPVDSREPSWNCAMPRPAENACRAGSVLGSSTILSRMCWMEKPP